MSLSIANHSASLPVAYRLYLPKEWDTDKVRRKKAGVPKDIRFKTKPEIALNQIRWACEAGLPRGVALMDAAYGVDSRLRTGMTALGVSYVVGIQPKLLMWPPGTEPKRKGRPLNNTGRRDEPDLISAKRITRDLPNESWQTIPWREGSAEWLSSRFAAASGGKAKRAHRLQRRTNGWARRVPLCPPYAVTSQHPIALLHLLRIQIDVAAHLPELGAHLRHAVLDGA